MYIVCALKNLVSLGENCSNNMTHNLETFLKNENCSNYVVKMSFKLLINCYVLLTLENYTIIKILIYSVDINSLNFIEKFLREITLVVVNPLKF